MNEEMLKKAKGAKSAAELKTIAAADGTELTDEQAEAYYAQLRKGGELADEELDNVAGGGCHKGDGRLIVTVGHYCEHWACKFCGSAVKNVTFVDERGVFEVHRCGGEQRNSFCNSCKYMSYENGLWLCNNPLNRS